MCLPLKLKNNKTNALLFICRSLEAVTDIHLFDSINSVWFFLEDKIIESIKDFLVPWIHNTGYPVIFIDIRSGGLSIVQVLITYYVAYNNITPCILHCGYFIIYWLQQRFGFTPRPNVNYDIPITYTTSDDPDFDNVYPEKVVGPNEMLDIDLDGGDWIIFNIQGQGELRTCVPIYLSFYD